MPCIRIKNGFVCGFHPMYRYKGFNIEIHPYCGPMKCNKNGDGAKRVGRKFYKVAQELMDMTKREREKYRVME